MVRRKIAMASKHDSCDSTTQFFTSSNNTNFISFCCEFAVDMIIRIQLSSRAKIRLWTASKLLNVGQYQMQLLENWLNSSHNAWNGTLRINKKLRNEGIDLIQFQDWMKDETTHTRFTHYECVVTLTLSNGVGENMRGEWELEDRGVAVSVLWSGYVLLTSKMDQ